MLYIILTLLSIPLVIQILLGFNLIKTSISFRLLSLLNIVDFGFFSYISYYFLASELSQNSCNTTCGGLLNVILIFLLILLSIIGVQFIINKRKK